MLQIEIVICRWHSTPSANPGRLRARPITPWRILRPSQLRRLISTGCRPPCAPKSRHNWNGSKVCMRQRSLQPVQTRAFAGYRCESYRADALKSERYIAHPWSPFPILAVPFNAGIPGLLLDMENTVWTLHAQEVRMNLPISNDLFAIPGGLKKENIASSGVHP
jgi:hypothetical protein